MKERLTRLVSSPVADLVLTVALFALGLTTIHGLGEQHTGESGVLIENSPIGILVLVVGVAPVAVRRRWPLASTIVAATIYAVLAVTDDADRTAWLLATIACFYLLSTTGSGRPRRIGEWYVAAVAVLSATVGMRSYSDEPLAWIRYGALELVAFVAVWVISTEVRRRRRGEARLAVRAESAEQRAAMATAEERARIARELHDLVGHAISVISVQATVGEHLAESDPDQARTALATISEVSKQAMVEMRHMVGVLRDDDGAVVEGRQPQPGLRDIDALVDEVRGRGTEVSLRIEEDAERTSPGLGLTIYRIVQEGLGNAGKHAPGAAVTVAITFDADAATTEVRNGPPTAPDPRGTSSADAVLGSSGLGLVGIRERAAMYAGLVESGPTSDGGFRLRARLPYDDEPAAPG